MNETYKQTICSFLSEKYDRQIEELDVDWDADIFNSGYLDSLDIYKLLLELEENLGVELPLSRLIGDFPRTFEALSGVIAGN